MARLRVKKPFATYPHRAELWRWAFLSGVVLWLLHPFATNRMIGTGDALWYAQMLADFVTQIRDGHFPVFVGQTEWAWNGAVYPLRVAPLYQHLGAAIDFVTGRQLGFFALQHAIVSVSGSLGLVSAYLCLRSIDPASPWRSAVLAGLYLSCPGVLGTIYTQDLYMTWMVLPFLPIAFLGAARTFERDDLTAQCLLAVGLAGTWLAHAPVALWLTLIVGTSQAVRLLFIHRRVPSWQRAAAGGALFALLGSYPFISVVRLQIPGVASAVASGLANDQQITQAIREVFPRVLQPLSESARALSDLQLGYALWVLLAFTVVVSCATGLFLRREERGTMSIVPLLLGACALLIVLLLPVPLVTEWLWNHVPGQIKRITFYWPMHRFYLLLAAMIVTVVQLTARRRHERWRQATMIVACLGLAWSLWECRQFVRAGADRTASTAISQRALRPENRLLMNHAYGLFAALPEHFTNGATDPRAEVRLFNARTGEELRGPTPTGNFIPVTGRIDANPGILRLDRELIVEPGQRYALDFQFRARDYTGILQLSGSTLFREYQLPRSGSERAFGTAPGNSTTLALWTTSREPERIVLRFIPTAPGATPGQFADFGELRFRQIDPASEPATLLGLVPLRVRTRASTPAELRTPRMAMLGYSATVDAAAASLSTAADGTVQVAVPAGEHIVELAYRAPALVQFSYFATLLAWAAVAALGALTVWRRRSASGAATQA
jgi:hypothetical protein